MAWFKKSADHIGRRLRMLRADAGLTVGDVARGLEVSRRQVRRWETGKEPVPEGARRAVADVLGVPVADLVPTREQSQVKVEPSALRVGAVERPIPAADPEAVLPGYLEMVYKLRGLEPGAPLPLRDEDLDALAVALGSDPDVIEERLLELITCSDEEAARLRALILRRRVASSAAGLAAGALALSGMSFDELFDDPPSTDDRVEIVTEASDDEPVATVGSSTTVAPPAAVGEPEPAPAPTTETPPPTTEPTVDIGEPLVIERPPPGSESESQEPEVGEGRTIERDPPGATTTEPEPEPAPTTTAPPDDSASDSEPDTSTESSTEGADATADSAPTTEANEPTETAETQITEPTETAETQITETESTETQITETETAETESTESAETEITETETTITLDDPVVDPIVTPIGVTLSFQYGHGPLADAVVLVQRVGENGWTNLGKTDAAGSLIASDLEPGDYTVRANLRGMEVVAEDLTIAPGVNTVALT